MKKLVEGHCRAQQRCDGHHKCQKASDCPTPSTEIRRSAAICQRSCRPKCATEKHLDDVKKHAETTNDSLGGDEVEDRNMLNYLRVNHH